MQRIDKLAWIYIKDGQLLATRSKNKELFYLPGGKRELGESDETALIREIKEELTVELIPATIHYLASFTAQAHDKPEGVEVELGCYQADFTGNIQANAEIEEVAWLTYQDKSSCSTAAKLVLTWLKAKELIA